MAFHLVDRSLGSVLPSLLLLGASMGCELVVRAALEGLHHSGRSEKSSTPVPFERAPWVDHGRVAQPGLLVQREGAREVRFVRDRGFPAWSLLLTIDGAPVAEFWEGEALALWLPSGHHPMVCHRRTRADKAVPLQPMTDSFPGSPAVLELEGAPSETVPCIRLAITGDWPRLIRLEPKPRGIPGKVSATPADRPRSRAILVS